MSEHDFFEAEAGQEGDEIAALKKSLLRVYACSMAKGRPDEARKTLMILARYLPEAAGPTAQHPAEMELETVVAHLGHLAPIGTPPTELARLAAAKILDLEVMAKRSK